MSRFYYVANDLSSSLFISKFSFSNYHFLTQKFFFMSRIEISNSTYYDAVWLNYIIFNSRPFFKQTKAVISKSGRSQLITFLNTLRRTNKFTFLDKFINVALPNQKELQYCASEHPITTSYVSFKDCLSYSEVEIITKDSILKTNSFQLNLNIISNNSLQTFYFLQILKFPSQFLGN